MGSKRPKTVGGYRQKSAVVIGHLRIQDLLKQTGVSLCDYDGRHAYRVSNGGQEHCFTLDFTTN